MRSYDTNYYVVTPSKFLHEFKTDDDFAKDPVPELSLYLPDCMVGAVSGQKFNVKGKDVSKGKLGSSFSMSHEIQFKAHTPQAANQWWDIIRQAAGSVTTEVPEGSVPVSPVASNNSPGGLENKQPAPLNTQGLERSDTVGTTPGSAVAPGSAVDPGSAVAPGTAAPHSAAPTSASAVPGEKY
jgi:hypothetical protein